MPRKDERKDVAMDAVLESSVGRRESRISDLSLGGCYVESMTNFTAGEPVSFDLIDANGVTMTFTGEVAYVLEGFGFGISFTRLTDEQTEFVRRSMPAE